VDETGRYLVYSVTKTFLAVLCLRLELDLDAPLSTWVDDRRLPDATLRQLLHHTSGIPDYGRLPEYAAAVRDSPGEPWDDEELVARSLAGGCDFPPGAGWAYSNTGYLLVRRILEDAAPGGLAAALARELLEPLGLSSTSLALEPGDLLDLAPARSTQVGDGEHDVRGRYHPRWVGHRTLASTAADQRRFWTALARGELCDLRVLADAVDVGREAPGFARPGYGLGVMVDRGRGDGVLIGHGGGGPGYAAAAFALLRDGDDPLVAVELSGDERVDVQTRALETLGSAT
jgi:D-alanyl-D-alanine carboxypeptidase